MSRSKTSGSNQIDMLNGPLLGKLWVFALPLAFSSILQQLFNSVDVAVVGHFASSQAQAAVGCNGPVINLLINLFVGISVGTNVVIATFIGKQRFDKVRTAVHTSIMLAVICGFALLVLGMVIARPILTFMDTPADVMEYAVLYLRIYFLGTPFIMLYNFGAAVLRSVGDTRRPLICLILAGVINTILNLVLVIVFHLGVAGVAIGTVMSNVVSSSMVMYFLMHEEGPLHFSVKECRIAKLHLLRIMRVGLPAGLQSMVFSLSNVFIQTALNGFGSDAVAGSAVALNYEYFTYFVIAAFNQTTVTFTSQNFGARRYDRCRQIFRLSMISAFLCSGLLGLLFASDKLFFASLFTSEAAVAEYAVERMTVVLVFCCIESSYEISGAALRGMGFSMIPAILTVFGTCVFRIVWIYTVCRMAPGFDTLMRAYPISWVLTGAAVLIVYFVIRRKVFKTAVRAA